MTLTYTYDPATAVGHVRLYTDDRDMSAADEALAIEKRSVIFADEEVQVFIDVNGGDLLLAAAHALRTIANNRSLFVARRRIGRTDVDFGELRRDLLKQADAFETQAQQGPADGFAEVVYDDFGLRRVVINDQLRHG